RTQARADAAIAFAGRHTTAPAVSPINSATPVNSIFCKLLPVVRDISAISIGDSRKVCEMTSLGRPAIRAAGAVALILIALVGIGSWVGIGHQYPESPNPPVINNSDSASTNMLNQTGGANSLPFD